jgi:hypothetical protein
VTAKSRGLRTKEDEDWGQIIALEVDHRDIEFG